MAGQTVELLPSDPEWPAGYQIHAEKIGRALRDAARRIEHIGSTSVPGLAAKPIIDILVVVDHPENEDSYVPSLVEAGYELRRREPELDEHRLLKGIGPAANVHVFGLWSSEVERYLIFRDLLRRDEKSRSEYEIAKRRLAAMEWPSTNDYAEAKSEIVQRLIALARGCHTEECAAGRNGNSQRPAKHL